MSTKPHRPGQLALLGKGHCHRPKNRPTRQQAKNRLRQETQQEAQKVRNNVDLFFLG